MILHQDHNPSSGSWFLDRATDSSRKSFHEPYYILFEVPHTMVSTVVHQLGWGFAGLGGQTLPWTLITTKTFGGLRGLRFEIGFFLPRLHKNLHRLFCAPHPVKGLVVHPFYVNINNEHVNGLWLLHDPSTLPWIIKFFRFYLEKSKYDF